MKKALIIMMAVLMIVSSVSAYTGIITSNRLFLNNFMGELYVNANDNSDIISRIESMNNNSRIIIPCGTYTLGASDDIDIKHHNIVISGMGACTNIVVNSGHTTNLFNFKEGSEKVVIEKLLINGQGGNVTAFGGSGGSNNNINWQYITIREVFVNDTKGGVSFGDNSNNRSIRNLNVINNEFINVQQGISVTGTNRISGNYIKGDYNKPNDEHEGLDIQNSIVSDETCIVTRNVIEGFKEEYIDCSCDYAVINNNNIYHNGIFYNNSNDISIGINVGESSASIVTGNLIGNISGVGIKVGRFNMVSNNNIRMTGIAENVSIGVWSNNGDFSSIVGNRIFFTANGIQVDSATNNIWYGGNSFFSVTDEINDNGVSSYANEVYETTTFKEDLTTEKEFYFNAKLYGTANQIVDIGGSNILMGDIDSADTSKNLVLRSAGSERITMTTGNEIKLHSISGDGSGKAVCIKADGNIGTCTDAVGVGGTCTCA